MKPSVKIGLIFGLITLLINIGIVLPSKDKNIGMILVSGLIFFSSLFSVLFTKKENGYNLTLIEGLKASVQSGLIMSIFYFFSIVLIQKYIQVGFFPDLASLKQYFLILNINIILFSILSAIFGVISSTLLFNQK